MRSLFAGVLVVAVAACTTTPSSPPPSASAAVTPAASGSPAPTVPATPTPTPGLASWAFTEVPVDGWPMDAAYGGGRWVIVTADPENLGHSAVGVKDGATWQSATIATGLAAVTWDGTAFDAVGVRCVKGSSPQVCGLAIGTWRSSTGIAWKRIDSFWIGDGVNGTAATIAGPLVAAADGSLVIGWIAANTTRTGTYGSRDGTNWQRIPPTAFDVGTKFPVVDVAGTDRGFLLLAGARQARVNAFRSDDGMTWRAVAAPDVTSVGALSLAADGAHVVAAIGVCVGFQCDTEIWSSDDAGAWVRDLTLKGVSGARVAFADRAFVLAGTVDDPRTTYLGTWRSEDGRAWSELRAGFGTVGFRDGSGTLCPVEFLSGGAGDVILGSERCGVWQANLP